MTEGGKMIQYGRQLIEQEDIESVVSVLQSDFLTQGPVTEKFENAVAEYCGARYAIAANSATSSLHLAMMALEINRNDLIWTSAITFVATSNAALYCGAKVDFIDIDEQTLNLDISLLEKKLQQAEANSNLPTVLLVVHLAGAPADMLSISKLSERYNFKVVEDASHAVGSSFNSKKIGSCEYSLLSIFSFHPVKIITTAEGGVITTNDPSLNEKIRRLRTHGISRNDSFNDGREELWNYFQEDLGYNYRMTELSAALGLTQVSKIDRFVSRRNEISEQYKWELRKLPLKFQKFPENSKSSHHLFIIRLKLDQIKKTKKQIYFEYLENNINVNFHYIPVYRHPFYEKLGFKKNYCLEAERYFLDALSIPLHPGLSQDDIERVIGTTKSLVE